MIGFWGKSWVLSGFDRLAFRGTIRSLAYANGLRGFLWAAGVLLKEFNAFALERTRLLRESTLTTANLANRPLIYLPSSRTSKQERAAADVCEKGRFFRETTSPGGIA